jgi:4,5-DOPA dioxygenase extradiol
MMPAVFIGHGNPMNAITDTPFSRAWQVLGKALPRPLAIVAISAHWFVDTTAVTVAPNPQMIYDFGGFPAPLYEVQYPAPGDPQLAADIAQMLAPLPVALDTEWGFDHGAWSVLVHTHPEADVPVIQLAIDARQPAAFHFDLGKRLAPLRERGILLLGSGNIVHNLRRAQWQPGGGDTYEWAARFDEYVRDAILAHDDAALIDYLDHPDGRVCAPTPDHYLPLLYIAGARQASDTSTFPIEGMDMGSISMRSLLLAS